jgi:L-lactate dehydrogenase complex protein LldG
MTAAETIRMFLANAAKAAAGTHEVDGMEGLRRALPGIVPAESAVYCPGITATEQALAGVFPHPAAEYGGAQVTVEEVFGAVAETGSIACASAGGRALQASLLPSHHIAIVPRERIFATLDDLFADFAGAPPTNLTLVTGPSRTADIELTLAIGVHGPEKLDLIVYGSEGDA